MCAEHLHRPPTFVSQPTCLSTSRKRLLSTPHSVSARRRQQRFHARIFDSLPFYRVALLRTTTATANKTEPKTSAGNLATVDHPAPIEGITTETETSSPIHIVQQQQQQQQQKQQKQQQQQIGQNTEFLDHNLEAQFEPFGDEQRKEQNVLWHSPPSTLVSPFENRFTIRAAQHAELYTAADIRCEAFYNAASDAHYRPVRRREIYMAMQSRVTAGTCCIVMIDNDPPSHWRSLSNEHGLVVATLDVTLHASHSGKRQSFDRDIDDEGGKVCAYISSMAVRRYWQGRGLAQRLLTHTANFVRESGVPDLFLHVDWENEAAVHVYSKHGFRIVTRPSGHWIHNLAKPEHTLMHLPLSSNCPNVW